MLVFLFTSVCIRMHIHTYTYAYTCIYIHIHLCTYMSIYIYVYTCIYIYTHIYVYIFIYISVYIYLYTYIYTCLHAYTPGKAYPLEINIRPYTQTHPRAHTHTHTHLYAHARTHTHTHTHANSVVCAFIMNPSIPYGCPNRVYCLLSISPPHCNTLQHTTINFNTHTLKCPPPPSVLKHTSFYSIQMSSMENQAPFFSSTTLNTLQHTVTPCNTLQHTIHKICSTLLHTIYIILSNAGAPLGGHTATHGTHCNMSVLECAVKQKIINNLI